MENRGFTIVELVITIFILSIAVIGVYNAFSILLIATTNTIDRLTAAYLAQEGVEIVRNIRDANWIAGNNWEDGLTAACADINGCQADYKTDGSNNPLAPFTESGSYLYIDSNGFYSYDITGKQTRFRRQIKITFLNEHVLKVEVTALWDEKPNILNSDRSFDWVDPFIDPFIAHSTVQGAITSIEYLYNWY